MRLHRTRESVTEVSRDGQWDSRETGPRTTLLVFAKEPLPGRVKTRLVPPLTPDEAARLSDAFLGDLLERARVLHEAEVVVALPSDSSRNRMAARFPTASRWVDQGEGNLGQRLSRTVDGEFRGGAAGVLVLGSDHPNIPLPLIEAVLDSVRGGVAAWIPTDDGGYAALGLASSRPTSSRMCRGALHKSPTSRVNARANPGSIFAPLELGTTSIGPKI